MTIFKKNMALSDNPKTNFFCPYCERTLATGTHITDGIKEGWNDIDCPSCKKSFRVFNGKVRAKRGRTLGGDREVSLRVLHNGIEDLIEYDCPKDLDVEMRAQDEIIIYFKTHYNGTLIKKSRACIIFNLTTRRGGGLVSYLRW